MPGPTDTPLLLARYFEAHLYVLLDQQVWHAYEVSEQGHLRRFNPYESSESLPASLPENA